MWQSKPVYQIVKSMMVAEALALVDATKASFWLSKLFIDKQHWKKKSVLLPLNCYIDSKKLHEAL